MFFYEDYCIECGRVFDLRFQVFHKQGVAKDSLKQFYICPHCRYEHTIMYIDDDVKDNFAKAKFIHHRIQHMKKSKGLYSKEKIKHWEEKFKYQEERLPELTKIAKRRYYEGD